MYELTAKSYPSFHIRFIFDYTNNYMTCIGYCVVCGVSSLIFTTQINVIHSYFIAGMEDPPTYYTTG